ncbi:hypothetical protein DPX16_2552 [Anabarilius grahami]|uniref:Uncharacterized protein n=1 Tax=Anabarilius grahami TaxID=495550 RepID=A0A3N0XEX5_ANAGA|nr:hypothetical protein DPX16_2552 [Anabarilius grahami]
MSVLEEYERAPKRLKVSAEDEEELEEGEESDSASAGLMGDDEEDEGQSRARWSSADRKSRRSQKEKTDRYNGFSILPRANGSAAKETHEAIQQLQISMVRFICTVSMFTAVFRPAVLLCGRSLSDDVLRCFVCCASGSDQTQSLNQQKNSSL